jgi:hypothetical protein
MPASHDARLRLTGTRFRLFPQPRFLPGYAEPEVVWVSSPRGTLRAGPGDNRMYVVDALDKQPYPATALPGWFGRRNPAAAPDADGHFDHLDPGSRAFGAAHMFGTVRRVLDIWEGYIGYPIEWHFQDVQNRLELIPYVEWDNAQAGYGYMETGWGRPREGAPQPFCLNFDVLAHETGHLVVFALLGVPDDATLTTEYRAFHESASDLVALLSALHFSSVVDRVLNACKGNLFVENELDRMAELSGNEQIRRASNAHRMSEVPDARVPWDSLTQRQLHQVSEPMTGAMFDILVEIFQELLVERGLITRALDERADRAADGSVPVEEVRADFEAAYAADPQGFRDALVRARDLLGFRLARTLQQTPPHDLHFADVAARFLAIDARRSGPRFRQSIIDSFLWRQIGYGLLA